MSKAAIGVRRVTQLPARGRAVVWLLAAIRGYQRVLSPLLGNCCRHEPSCSRYASLCLKHLPLGKALWLTIQRLLRCNPLFAGGLDLPPLPASAPAADKEPDWSRLDRIYGFAATGVNLPAAPREACPCPNAIVAAASDTTKANAVLSEHPIK